MTRLNSFGQPIDRIGRQVPHRFNVLSFVRGVGGFADQLRPLPDGHAAFRGTTATVNCPCNHKVTVELLGFTRCEGGCGRIYSVVGATVFVAYGTADTPESGS